MSKIERAKGFKITVERAEITRYLGYGDNEIPPRVMTAIKEIEEIAPTLLEPVCAFRTMTHDEYYHSHFVCHISALVVCLVTIGPKLDNVVNEFKLAGDLSRALILDSYGSAATEAAAEQAEAIIGAKIEESGLKCSRRFSPGYGGWNVAEQKWLFAAVEGDSLGVSLTEGAMMNPRKSVTFAVAIGDHPVDMRNADVCEHCGMVNCRFKLQEKP